MQDEVNRYENPNIFVKATNLIPFVKEGREKDHEQRMDNLNRLTAEEQEIINQDPYLNQTIENKIHSGNWHDSAM